MDAASLSPSRNDTYQEFEVILVKLSIFANSEKRQYVKREAKSCWNAKHQAMVDCLGRFDTLLPGSRGSEGHTKWKRFVQIRQRLTKLNDRPNVDFVLRKNDW